MVSGGTARPAARVAIPHHKREVDRDMKADIHPVYQDIKATCSCGNVVETRSTIGKDILIEVCSNCHPFYTGKQKIMDTAGRVDRFNKRFGNRKV
jgi:large subunit ribosomal protein L31